MRLSSLISLRSFLVAMIKIPQPKSSRAFENEFARFLKFMTSETAKTYKKDVLEKITKTDERNFADNYAEKITKLARLASGKILKQFSEERLEEYISKHFKKASKRDREQLYGLIEDKVGLNTRHLITKDDIDLEMQALIVETREWAIKLRDENLEQFTTSTLHNMVLGNSLDQLLSSFDDLVAKRSGHSQFLAFNQMQNFNAITNKLRVQKLGIEKGIWVTARDESVRPCHQDRDGKEYDLSKGLYSSCDGKWLIAGTDYRCRCTTMYVFEDD